MAIDNKALLERFLAYVQIDSETGSEAAMTARLVEDFKAIGCEVTTDDIKEAAQTTGANVYATLPGNPDLEPLMFSAHMDTVVPGNGVKPRVDADGYVRTDGTTVLGGDDKAGVAEIMTLVETLQQGEIPHGFIGVAFLVCWTLLFIIWLTAGLPIGLGTSLFYPAA